MSYLKNNSMTDPSLNLKDLTENNDGLILLTGNYTNFCKTFYKNKLKEVERILISLKIVLKIDYILRFNVIMNFKKKL